MSTATSSQLMPTQIRAEVLTILRQANTFMSAYQVLDRLSTRDQLIRERGLPGLGSGTSYTAASVIAQAIQMLEGEPGYQPPIYLLSRGVVFEVAGELIQSGYESCALYRITT